MGVNRVFLIGNVGKQPEIRRLDSGVAVANFPLATSETYKNKAGEKVTDTVWHNIVIWRGLADVVEKFVNVGDSLYLEGKITNRSWDDKDGNKRYTTEIVVNNMQMLGGKGNEQTQSEPAEPTGNTTKPEDEPDDLPF